MLLLQKLLLENSKLYSSQSQRNYYFDYSQSFIIRTEKKKIRNRWKVSNYAHFQFSNRAFNEITAQPCVTRHRHEKLFEVPRARFPFARVRRKCFGFRAFGRAPGIINHPLPCITYIAGTIVRSARRGGGEKEKEKKGEEERRRRRREREKDESVGGESKRNGRGEANLNLESESEWTARPCARTSGLPYSPPLLERCGGFQRCFHRCAVVAGFNLDNKWWRTDDRGGFHLSESSNNLWFFC